MLPRVLLIGASTGGPQALAVLLDGLGATIERVPVLITQHMPATFTTILAEHLRASTGRPAREAADGEAIAAGNIYRRARRPAHAGRPPQRAGDDRAR